MPWFASFSWLRLAFFALLFGFSASAQLEASVSPLQDYERYNSAKAVNDYLSLEALLPSSTGYLRYLILLALAEDPSLSLDEELTYYREIVALAPKDSLAKQKTIDMYLRLAELARTANQPDIAREAYKQALPEQKAIQGLLDLNNDPIALANTFVEARLFVDALSALNNEDHPEVEALALRRSGKNQRALVVYDELLAKDPNDQEALLGKAWTYYNLRQNDTALALFARVSDDSARYGEGLIALRNNDIRAAALAYSKSYDPDLLWMASSYFEDLNEPLEAIKAYERLAQGDSDYANDAAYRIEVLAKRHNVSPPNFELLDDPFNSFFRAKLGMNFSLNENGSLATPDLPVLGLAETLVQAGMQEAAVGELLFALREAQDEASAISIAEAMQALGEFRHSHQAAEDYLMAGSQYVRTWRVAFPRAYETEVVAEANKNGIEPALIWAVMWKESRFASFAVSHTGAKGLMQFIQSTWNWMAELQNETPGDPFNPSDSIAYGAAYLSYLDRYFSGDLELAIPAYNGGQGYIRRSFEAAPISGDKDEFYRYLDRTEPREYLQSVSHIYEVYRTIYP